MTTTARMRGVAVGAAALLALSTHQASANNAAPLWVGWDVSLEGGLSFMSHGSKHVWAQDTTLNLIPLGVSSSNREIAPDIGITGKVKATLRWGTWDIGAAYRGTLAFEEKDRSEARIVPPLGIKVPVGTQAFFNTPIPFPIPAFGAEADTKQNSNQHVADFVVGYNKSYGWGEARVFGGLRFALLNVDTETSFSTVQLLNFNVKRDSTYWGIGPTLGAEFKYLVGRRWIAGAAVQGAVLFGNRSTDDSISVNIPPAGFSATESTSNGGMRTAFSLDAEVTLTYQSLSGMYFAIGYGFQGLWGVNDTRYVDTVASFSSGSLVTGGSSGGSVLNHGPFVRMGILFGGYSPRRQSADYYKGDAVSMGAKNPDDWRFDIALEGAFLFFGSSSRNVFSQDTTISFPPFAVSQKNREIEPDYALSGGIVARYRIRKKYDVGFAYRGAFTGDEKDHSALNVAINPGSIAVTFPVHPSLFNIPIINLNVPIPGLTANSESKSKQHVVDLEAGYYMPVWRANVRLFAGLRFAYIDNDTDTLYSAIGLIDADISRDSTYWGIGPRLGGSFELPVFNRISLGGSAAGAILFGDRSTDNTTKVSIPLLGGVNITQTDNNGGMRTAFSLDAEINLTYRTAHGFYAQVGYMMRGMWGVNDTRYVDTLASFNAGTLVTGGSSGASQILHGPFLRLGMRF